MTDARPRNLTRKLLDSHLVGGRMEIGEEIQLSVDQVLVQDGTSVLTFLALEAMGLDRIKVDLAAQYVDHNLVHGDYRNGDDHVFLLAASRRFGAWYGRAGTGVCHVVHMERFGVPGTILFGSDSHTPGAGSLGVLAFGAGSVEVATVMAGEPLNIPMPEVWGIKLTGTLPEWVSARNIILELLRRHSVKGGVGRVMEYYGPGVAALSAMDRHVICNQGTEMGATSSIFPSDDATRRFLADHGREGEWRDLAADAGAAYDVHDEVDLSGLEPMIARPPSPDNVVPVREVAGEPVYQAYLGSCANPGFRDFAVAAGMMRGRQVAPGVSFDVNPVSRQLVADLIREGHLNDLVQAGARLHQVGCNGCMGSCLAPATGVNSLRTTTRNYAGRSGTKGDSVFLSSPEVIAAAALTGRITDPRDLGIPCPEITLPVDPPVVNDIMIPPPSIEKAREVELVRGPNIALLPVIEPLADSFELPVLLKLGDGISTDDLAPGGARGMPFRSNVQALSQYCLDRIDGTYPARAAQTREAGGHALVAGANFGQGSSREHASLAPQYLGLRVVLARGYARIYRQNLINAAVLPLVFEDEADYDRLEADDVILLDGVRDGLGKADRLSVRIKGKDGEAFVRHGFSERQLDVVLAGGLVKWLQAKNR